MGYASRLNPASTDCKSVREGRRIMTRRLLAQFTDRAEYDTFLGEKRPTPEQRTYLDSLLPDHLRANG